MDTVFGFPAKASITEDDVDLEGFFDFEEGFDDEVPMVSSS